MNKKIVMLLLCIFFISILGCSELEEYEALIDELPTHNTTQSTPRDGNTLLIANWNLQIFGQTKASNSELMSYYVENIVPYDIVVIQEIRDSEETAFPKLCEQAGVFECVVSSRSGRSSSKEQYGVMYRGVELLEVIDFAPEYQDAFERPPYAIKFSSGDENFWVVTIHAKPSDVQAELRTLQQLLSSFEGDIIILGDLNADCDYYDEEEEEEFDSWFWVIPSTADTTVAQSSCAYDRFILNNESNEDFLGYGIMSNVVKEQSDHYLIWGEFNYN